MTVWLIERYDEAFDRAFPDMPSAGRPERASFDSDTSEVAAGKPVPAEVLKDYPNLARGVKLTGEPLTPLETSKQREDRVFRETEAKFAEEAASTETISEREARRAAEAGVEVKPRWAEAVVTVGQRFPLGVRDIDAVERSARLAGDVAAKLASFKAAERDFRMSRRAIKPRRKVRLD